MNLVTGTGKLGEVLGVNRNGIRVGGINISDVNGILSGGLGPGKWTGDSLTLADLSIDTEEFGGWEGGLFGTQFLYFTSGGPGYDIAGIEQGKNDPNALAGTVMGFNSLVATQPLSRAELYQLWFRQELFDRKFVFRIGKSVPTFDFNNVLRAVPLQDNAETIQAISSVLYTPVFVNPTMLGVMPGYYNSATGLVASLVPNNKVYAQYGLFDGNLARGVQTGLTGPHFNGYALHLGEVGFNWRIGADEKPGKFGIGGWGQTGKLRGLGGEVVDGAGGVYLFASQRLYWEAPGRNHNGLTSFFQFGATNSDIVFTHRYFGMGLTYFGPIPGRDDDSVGFGLAYGVMNDEPKAGSVFFTLPPGVSLRSTALGKDETILTWYYQMKMADGLLFQPNLTYVPSPARHEGIPGAFALTLRMILLF
ncbi:carbohydrate porin [Aquisphaera giovannonii]|uniref:carbohydrate porin n=1 Tax=Aquisphaera giovannonii TaxID=406548 RepID=UPI00143DE439|nr:carbohydrate porin [Aquisphaera giovannonii]